MSISADYREEVELEDGSRVLLRTVRPEDKPLFQRGLARLSAQSRWRRFLAARGEFSPAELIYLTEVDGNDHFAIGALKGDEGVGVARFVRDAHGSEVAEPAVVVTDEMQGKGLGRILLSRLVEAARERGVKRFHGEVLADNAPMLALVDEISPGALRESSAPGVLLIDIPLEGHGATGEQSLLSRILALAAEGVLCLVPRHARGGDGRS